MPEELDPLHEPSFFMDVTRLYSEKIILMLKNVQRTGAYIDRTMGFDHTIFGLNFEEANRLELTYIDPPNIRENNCHFNVAMRLYRGNEPHTLNADLVNRDELPATTSEMHGDQAPDFRDGRYEIIAALGRQPFIMNRCLLGDEVRNQIDDLDVFQRKGLAYPLQRSGQETVLRLIEYSTPNPAQFNESFRLS